MLSLPATLIAKQFYVVYQFQHLGPSVSSGRLQVYFIIQILKLPVCKLEVEDYLNEYETN